MNLCSDIINPSEVKTGIKTPFMPGTMLCPALRLTSQHKLENGAS